MSLFLLQMRQYAYGTTNTSLTIVPPFISPRLCEQNLFLDTIWVSNGARNLGCGMLFNDFPVLHASARGFSSNEKNKDSEFISFFVCSILVLLRSTMVFSVCLNLPRFASPITRCLLPFLSLFFFSEALSCLLSRISGTRAKTSGVNSIPSSCCFRGLEGSPCDDFCTGADEGESFRALRDMLSRIEAHPFFFHERITWLTLLRFMQSARPGQSSFRPFLSGELLQRNGTRRESMRKEFPGVVEQNMYCANGSFGIWGVWV